VREALSKQRDQAVNILVVYNVFTEQMDEMRKRTNQVQEAAEKLLTLEGSTQLESITADLSSSEAFPRIIKFISSHINPHQGKVNLIPDSLRLDPERF